MHRMAHRPFCKSPSSEVLRLPPPYSSFLPRLSSTGKEKRRDLIRELRYDEQLTTMEAELTQSDAAHLLREQRDALMRALLGTVGGEVVGTALDYLTKELVRFREERRVAAMVQLAERTRRLREAEESGLWVAQTCAPCHTALTLSFHGNTTLRTRIPRMLHRRHGRMRHPRIARA